MSQPEPLVQRRSGRYAGWGRAPTATRTTATDLVAAEARARSAEWTATARSTPGTPMTRARASLCVGEGPEPWLDGQRGRGERPFGRHYSGPRSSAFVQWSSHQTTNWYPAPRRAAAHRHLLEDVMGQRAEAGDGGRLGLVVIEAVAPEGVGHQPVALVPRLADRRPDGAGEVAGPGDLDHGPLLGEEHGQGVEDPGELGVGVLARAPWRPHPSHSSCMRTW